jgi:hypothetical protein
MTPRGLRLTGKRLDASHDRVELPRNGEMEFVLPLLGRSLVIPLLLFESCNPRVYLAHMIAEQEIADLLQLIVVGLRTLTGAQLLQRGGVHGNPLFRRPVPTLAAKSRNRRNAVAAPT